MISIRKFFSILNKKERELIKKESEQFLEVIDTVCTEKNIYYSKYENRINSTCPMCSHTIVINKYVITSKVSGDIFDIDTTEHETKINECGKCGHQWKKCRPSFTFKSDVLETLLHTIKWDVGNQDLYQSPEYKFMLKNVHAETFYKVFCDHVLFGKDKIKLSMVRKILLSIYDIKYIS